MARDEADELYLTCDRNPIMNKVSPSRPVRVCVQEQHKVAVKAKRTRERIQNRKLREIEKRIDEEQ